jgi:putative transposase
MSHLLPMPDHMHLLWTGVFDESDQLLAMRHFRKAINPALEKLSARLQLQAYDHVLRDDERLDAAFANVAEYIARNPERKGLVQLDRYQEYPYTGCLAPGYPELKPFQKDFWERFWRIYSYWQRDGMGVVGPRS